MVQTVRKKAEDLGQESESLMRERVRLETQLAQVQCVFFHCPSDPPRASDIFFFKYLSREKRKADEPRVEALSKENETLNTELLAQRDVQLTLLQEIETLKNERAALVQKKVRTTFTGAAALILSSSAQRSDAERPR